MRRCARSCSWRPTAKFTSIATWRIGRAILHKPYTKDLIRILGEPIALEDMWNPDAMLRVEDIRHKEDTQERLDKAAATQMVFEDALIHIIDHLIRRTGSDQLVLTGGTALNAVGSMRLLEHFDETYYQRQFGRRARLHLWVPPTPNDAGVAMGAAFMGAYLAGSGSGEPLEHAFYCGAAPSDAAIRDAFAAAPDVAWTPIGNVTSAARPRGDRRSHGVYDGAGRHHRALPGRGRDRAARARASFDPRQSAQSAHARDS